MSPDGHLALKLRTSLANLVDMASIDFNTTATHYAGNIYTIDPADPVLWMDQAGKYVRDISVVAGATAKELKQRAKPGGRPKHAAARILINDLAVLYHRLTKRIPGRHGRFPKFVEVIVECVDRRLLNQGLEHLIREIAAEYKTNLGEI